MKRLKYRIKLDYKEIQIVEQALLLYQENNATDEKLFFKISRLIERFYVEIPDKDKNLETYKSFLEENGFEVSKLRSEE